MFAKKNIKANKNEVDKQIIELNNLLDSIRSEIKTMEDDKQMFIEVVEHMEHGGGAKGIVWEYSQFMTREDASDIIITYDERIEDLKCLFGELEKSKINLMINSNIENNIDINKDILKNVITTDTKKLYNSIIDR